MLLTCLHEAVDVKDEGGLAKIDPDVFARLLQAHGGKELQIRPFYLAEGGVLSGALVSIGEVGVPTT